MAMRRQSGHFFRLGCNGLAAALDSRGLGMRAASSLSSERRCSVNAKSEVVKGKVSTNMSARSVGTVAREEMEGDGEALLVRYLERLKNFEKEGVPKGAGTDSPEGFDLERMKRLLSRLGNPLSAYPACSDVASD